MNKGTLKALLEHKRENTICRSCSLNDSGVNKGTLKALIKIQRAIKYEGTLEGVVENESV